MIDSVGLNSLTFDVPTHRVLEAATNRAGFHHEREQYWIKENAAAVKDIQTSGVKVNVAAITGGYRDEVDLDPALKRRIAEAQSKATEHREKAEQFWAIVAALEFAGSSVPLTVGDIRLLQIGVSAGPGEESGAGGG